MRRILVFTLLLGVYFAVRIFYRLKIHWVKPPGDVWDRVRLYVFINHTSLFDVLYLGSIPIRVLWIASSRAVAPGADKTLKRPIAGKFFKFLAPKMISVSRKRDATWDHFIHEIGKDSMIVIFAEGRMMREKGKDRDGNPMSIRGGVADVLEAVTEGTMVIGYGGGMHHVQFPGQKFPRLFKTIELKCEPFDIQEYKRQVLAQNGANDSGARSFTFRKAVVEDLERRKRLHVSKEYLA